MNYLAHLSLAYPDSGLMGGNYINDLISRKEAKEIHPFFHQGIQHHKWIDHFSNNSSHLSQLNKYLHPVIHKYAPVASDILCDYILYQNWNAYFNFSFESFEIKSYQLLEEAIEWMPKRVAIICQSMISHRWMSQYQSIEGIREVLKRTGRKTKFEVNLELSIPIMEQNYEKFSELFHSFYQECILHNPLNINLQNEKIL